MVESMRLAFADARMYIADQATNPAPLEFLLSESYAAQRRAMINPALAMQPPGFGAPLGGSNTVYLSTADGEGNACSFINSLYDGFGSGVVANEAGFFLQNRGACFSLVPDHANELAPNKRPYHTIIPAMATDSNGDLWASFGVMGGFIQPQGHFQVLVAMIDDQLNPQEALNRPRWRLEEIDIPPVNSPPFRHSLGSVTLALEDGIPFATASQLANMGHRIRPVSGDMRRVFGDGQIIRRDPSSGVLFGGSDPRKDGQTAGF
jgi:gamma-glutamyltranspeptidase/glutathione hydrolase